MPAAFVRSHAPEFVKAAGTTDAYALTSLVPAGNLLVATLVHDNAASANTPTISSISKPAGETASWVFLGRATYPNAATAGAFGNGEMWCIKTTVDWPNATALTFTYSASNTMKAQNLLEFSGAEATVRSTTGTAYSTTTTAASAVSTSTTPVVGDLALGLLFGSNAVAAQAGDTDSTGGSWSTPIGVGSTGGSTATNNYGISQYKILTAASHQTYNNSAAMTAGNGSIVAILQATSPPSAVTQAAYRFYADGFESNSTALTDQDTVLPFDPTSGDVNLQLRMRLQNTDIIPIASTNVWQLQYELNFTDIWTNVTTSSSEVAAYNSANISSSNLTGTRLTGGTGFHQNGRASETGSLTSVNVSAGNHTEVLYSLTLKAADLADDVVVRFRVLRNDATTDLTYTQVPTIALTSARPAIETLVDPFDSLSAQWTPWNANTTWQAPGQIRMAPPKGVTVYTGIEHTDQYALRDSRIFVECVDAGNLLLPSWEAYPILLQNDARTATIQFFLGGESISANMTGVGSVGSVTYSPVNHRWVQIRETDGTTYFETSPDGVTWNVLHSRATTTLPAAFDPDLVWVQMSAGTWSGSEPSATALVVDNLNTVPSGAPVEQFATANLTVTSTLSTAGIRSKIAAASLSTTSTLTATSTNIRVTSTALSSVSTLAATGVRQPQVAASLTAAATLTATALRTQHSITALAASSTLTTTTFEQALGAASLSAESSLTATATTVGVQQASAVLAASSTLTAAAVRQPQAAASLVAASMIVATVVRTAPATGVLSGVSTLTVAGVREPQAAASLVASSTLTTTALRTQPTTAILTAISTVTTGSVVTEFATTALAATSTLTASAGRVPQAAASLTAAATLTATALRTAPVTATFTAIATLTPTAVGITVASAAASLTATSTFAATAVRQPQAAASLTATSTLTASVVRVVPTSAELSATSVLVTTSVREPHAVASLTATSTLIPTLLRTQQATVALTATSTLTSLAVGVGVVSGAAALTGSSTLAATGVRTTPASAALAATSTLAATGVRQPQAASSLVATATLAAAALRTAQGAVSLSATSTLAATAIGVGVVPGAAALTATSALTTTGIRTTLATASLAATSTLTTTAVRQPQAAASLTAASTLTVAAVRQPMAAVPLSATSALVVVGVRQLQTMATLTAEATLDALAVQLVPGTGIPNVALDGTLHAKDVDGDWYPVRAIL